MNEGGLTDTVADVAQDAKSIAQQLIDKVEKFIGAIKDNLANIIMGLALMIIILILSKLVLSLVSSITRKAITKNRERPDKTQSPRFESMMTLFRSTARYLVYFFAILGILHGFGFGETTKSLFAGAGIGALAIGFGAQNLVKDVVTGIFLMFENQYSVGDYIKTEDHDGIVEAVALRVTYLRSFKGDLVIIPNGTISRVINYTKGGYMAIVDIGISYKSDTRAVINVINTAVQRYADEHENMIEERPKVLGITAFDDSFLKVRVVCKAKRMMQWDVERGLRLIIKETFDASGIEFAHPRVIYERDEKKAYTSSDYKHTSNSSFSDGDILRPVWQLEDINLEGGNTDDGGK